METCMALYTPVIIYNACQEMCTAFTVHQILDWELNSPDESKKKNKHKHILYFTF